MTDDVLKGADRRIGHLRFGNARKYIFTAILFAIPFAAIIYALDGLRDTYGTFHGGDELEYHYPAIKSFVETFPQMKLWDYSSATTPLFHVVTATLGKYAGMSLPILRLINVIATYCLAWVMLIMLHKVLKADWWTSAFAALTLVLSPYVFGTSFILLTDNLAMLFAAVSLALALSHIENGDWETLACAVLFATLAILTRQLYLWLLPIIVAASYLGMRQFSFRIPFGLLALLCLSMMPFLVLALSWGGLNPPTFQQFSEGNPRAFGFLTACIGAYGAAFLLTSLRTPIDWRDLAQGRHFLLGHLLLVCGLTVLMLLSAPLRYVSLDSNCGWQQAACFPTDGYLWRLSSLFPTVGGSSLLFWILVPLGLMTMLHSWQEVLLRGIRRERLALVPVLIYLTYGIMLSANASPFQKYYDHVALLICIMIFLRAGRFHPSRARLVLLTYCAGFAFYAIRPLLA